MDYNPFTLRIGTRSSKLALKQTNLFEEALKNSNLFKKCDVKIEIVKIITKGDKIHHKPLREIYNDKETLEGKNAFTSELQEALRDKKIDIAIHSVKDIAGNVRHDGLNLSCFLKAGDDREIIIINKNRQPNINSLLDLKKTNTQLVIGTVSLRRQAYLQRINKDIIVKNLRGSITTRLDKLLGNFVWQKHPEIKYDAIVMAKVALDRLSNDSEIKEKLQHCHIIELSHQDMLPAAGQAVIGIENRTLTNSSSEKDIAIQALLNSINHQATYIKTSLEREVLYQLQGNCHTTIAVNAQCFNSSDATRFADTTTTIELTSEIFNFNASKSYKYQELLTLNINNCQYSEIKNLAKSFSEKFLSYLTKKFGTQDVASFTKLP